MPIRHRSFLTGLARLLAFQAALLMACGAPPTDPADDPAFAKASASGPTVTGADPEAAPQGATLDVHVFGSGFDQGSTVAFARGGVVDPKLAVSGSVFRNNGELVATVSIAPDAETVTYDIVVTTSKGKKGIGTERFAVEFPIETLAAPTGGSNVSDVSAAGVIVGTISTSCGPGFAPALWSRTAQLTALPSLPGTCGGSARAVNGSGVVVGSGYTGASASVPVRWTPVSGGYVADQLPLLPGGLNPGPWDVNDSGAITAGNEAAVWTQATGWQLLAKPSGGSGCVATMIGETGQMTATCMIGGKQRGVFWASATSAPILLPLPSGATSSKPRGLNGAGIVVGWIVSAGVNRPVRWVPAGASWTVELLHDPGKGGAALAINEAGLVVGSVNSLSGTGYPRPAFWEPGGLLHLLESRNGVGDATGVSESADGLVIGGYIRAGKNGGDRIASRWQP